MPKNKTRSDRGSIGLESAVTGTLTSAVLWRLARKMSSNATTAFLPPVCCSPAKIACARSLRSVGLMRSPSDRMSESSIRSCSSTTGLVAVGRFSKYEIMRRKIVSMTPGRTNGSHEIALLLVRLRHRRSSRACNFTMPVPEGEDGLGWAAERSWVILRTLSGVHWFSAYPPLLSAVLAMVDVSRIEMMC